jgi:hypothetical protein
MVPHGAPVVCMAGSVWAHVCCFMGVTQGSVWQSICVGVGSFVVGVWLVVCSGLGWSLSHDVKSKEI